jgi:hypothetical protein
MKPIVGIGTVLKEGKVVWIARNGVIVEKNGEKVTVAFAKVESEVFGG